MAPIDIENRKDRRKTAVNMSLLYIIMSLTWLVLGSIILKMFYIDEIPIVAKYIISTILSAIVIFIVITKSLEQLNQHEKEVSNNLKEIETKQEIIKKASEGLSQQSELIKDILESADVHIIRLDKDFNITKVSKTIGNIASIQVADLKGKPLASIVDQDSIEEIKENISKHDKHELELKLDTKCGKGLYMHGTIKKKMAKIKSNIHYILVLCNISERKTLENKVNYLDSYDSLTDLPNRDLMERAFNLLLPGINKIGNPVALLYIDIDDFAYINETKGYHAGDKLLIDMANIIKSCAKDTDIVSRITQDKFAIIFTEEESLEAINERICNILKETKIQWDFEDTNYMISTTIGVDIYPESGEDFVNLLKNANLALECAKQNSRTSYEYYSPDNSCSTRSDLTMLSDIKLALENGDFYMNYQPICNLETGEIVNVESLIRWFHPEKGYISPGYFIPVAEKAGMIDEIGEYTLDEVFSQKAKWNKMDYKLEKISINISAISFGKEGFAKMIKEKLERYGLDGNEIILELTESGFASSLEKIQKNIDHVRKMGIEVAMDDFGTGYSSLARLKDLQIDYLKLDRAFIVSLLEENGQEVIKPLISLAKALGKSVIAEGIETEEQYNILKRLGCQFGQGYFLARPMGAIDLLNL